MTDSDSVCVFTVLCHVYIETEKKVRNSKVATHIDIRYIHYHKWDDKRSIAEYYSILNEKR